jgi:DNA-binding response OmpR family regulator
MPIHVVLCESQPDVARLVSCRLMRADFEVHSARDVETAWEVIRRVRPAVLIAELQYPGIDLLCRLRSCPDTADLPVIALTSVVGPRDAMDTLQHDLGLAAVVAKPFSLRRLVRLAEEVTQPAVLPVA